MLKSIAISLVALFLLGCANVTPTGGPYKSMSLNQNEGELVIYRTGGYPLMAGDIAQVFANGKPIGHLYHGMFVQEAMPTGEYVIQVQRSPNPKYFWRFNPVAISIVVKPSEKVFVELDMTTVSSGMILPIGGFVVGGARPTIQLRQVAGEAGQAAVREMQRVLSTDK